MTPITLKQLHADIRLSILTALQCSWLIAGDYDNAIDYLVTMGGIARENDYEYLGQDNFCKKDYMAYSDKHESKLIKVKVRDVHPDSLCQLAA